MSAGRACAAGRADGDGLETTYLVVEVAQLGLGLRSDLAQALIPLCNVALERRELSLRLLARISVELLRVLPLDLQGLRTRHRLK